MFSAAVRQYGFPYKWVQSLCGISVLGEGGEGGSVQPTAETSVESMEGVMAALKKRFRAQVNLAQQVVRLGEEGGRDGGRKRGREEEREGGRGGRFHEV